MKESSKKSTVKKIQFNSYGDKFVSLSVDGCLFVHTFDLTDEYSPLVAIKGQKISDFGMIDSDASIIVAQSSSNKSL